MAQVKASARTAMVPASAHVLSNGSNVTVLAGTIQLVMTPEEADTLAVDLAMATRPWRTKTEA